MAHLLLVQGGTILLSIALSTLVFFPLGTITANFGDNCLLFSSIYLSSEDLTLQKPAKLCLTKTIYGSQDECNYTTFLSVTVAVAGLVFLWFLLHLGRVSEYERSGPGFLVSIFLFYLVLLICVIVSSIKISSGFRFWCDNINICRTTDTTCSNCRRVACEQFSQLNLTDITEDTTKFYTYFEIAEISSWLLAVTLFIECLVTSQRIYQNFQNSLLEEDESVKILDENAQLSNEIIQISKTGIINVGSDDYTEDFTPDQLSDGSDPGKKTITEVTVHQGSVTMSQNGSYEMSAIPGPSDVQILSEAAGKSPTKKLREPRMAEVVDDSEQPKSRRRKAATKTQASTVVEERNADSNQVKTDSSVQKLHENYKDIV